jgi:hypothetical protein
MTDPARLALRLEDHPVLPPGNDERVSGYGVMGLPFRSGHVLGLRRWTASSVGEGFTSIWHRDPAGRWTFYETVGSNTGCTRFFGAGVERVRVEPIAVRWTDERSLRVCTVRNDAVDWSVELGATPVTRLMSVAGSRLPLRAWRSRRVLGAMGVAAGRALRVGTVRLTGTTSDGQRFDANPLRVWRVTSSRATVEGEDVGPVGPLAEQARLADFYIPQRGVFAIGRVFVTGAPADQAGRG